MFPILMRSFEQAFGLNILWQGSERLGLYFFIASGR